MGRAATRKWVNRVSRYRIEIVDGVRRKTTLTTRLFLLKLFGRHKRFRKAVGRGNW